MLSKIGIRPVIDGRQFGIRESLEVQTMNMAKAAAENIPHRIDAGIVLTKYDHAKGEIPDFTILEAGHPLPDENTILGTLKRIRCSFWFRAAALHFLNVLPAS